MKAKLRKGGSAFLNNREEVLRRLPTGYSPSTQHPKDKRMSMLKPQKVLQEMDDEDIFCTSALDRYAMPPDVLEDMCLAEFVATYTTGGTDASNDAGDHIPDVLEGSDEN